MDLNTQSFVFSPKDEEINDQFIIDYYSKDKMIK